MQNMYHFISKEMKCPLEMNVFGRVYVKHGVAKTTAWHTGQSIIMHVSKFRSDLTGQNEQL